MQWPRYHCVPSSRRCYPFNDSYVSSSPEREHAAVARVAAALPLQRFSLTNRSRHSRYRTWGTVVEGRAWGWEYHRAPNPTGASRRRPRRDEAEDGDATGLTGAAKSFCVCGGIFLLLSDTVSSNTAKWLAARQHRAAPQSKYDRIHCVEMLRRQTKCSHLCHGNRQASWVASL